MKRVFFFSLIFIVLTSCSTVKPVSFKTPVDTNSKTIARQLKKTFALEDISVYASNEFDGARLNDFKKVNDSTVEVLISPENTPINNSGYYAFKTWSSTPKALYYKFTYPKGYKHRYIPKLKTNDVWSVVDSSRIIKNDSIVTVKINLTQQPIIVAAQEIQSSKDVKDWYTKLINGKDEIVELDVFGKSPLNKNLSCLSISNGSTKGKDVIVLLTRQHPPEVTGYFAFQSFMQTILNGSELSNAFLKKYHILAFPIMNPDGVDLGHWRHNSNGVDTNRDWSLYNQPEIKQTVNYIHKVLKKNKSKIIIGLDFHSTYKDVFYTNKIRKETTLPKFIDEWFAGLESNIPDYKVNEAAGNSTKPVSKGWFLYGHNAVGITYEIGDATPKKDIELIGRVSAEQMMKILTQ